MTYASNARLAGTAYVLYIATGIGSMAVPAQIRPVLGTVMAFCALALGATLYAITRHVDRDLALFAMLCRVIEAGSSTGTAEIYFATGSTIFCWLLLKGRTIPVWLSSLGLLSSGGLVVQLLALKIAGTTTNWSSPITWAIWFPLLVFELWFAAVLLANRLTPPPPPA
ncbi:MAG: hypothetical protein ACKVU1_05470 [bacterium]